MASNTEPCPDCRPARPGTSLGCPTCCGTGLIWTIEHLTERMIDSIEREHRRRSKS